MRGRAKTLGIMMIILILIMTGCTQKATKLESAQKETLVVEDLNEVDIKKLNHYDIEVKFFPEEGRIEATQKVDYINNENVALKEVYFHLYPNAFKKEEKAPFLFDDFSRAYPEGFKPGLIDIKSLSVDGEKGVFEILGEQETILKVNLPKGLDLSERTTIEMTYEVKLPPAQERFGYGESTFNFGNWYPIAAVYDDTGWNLDPYYAIGDPFYSDVNNYKVTIHTPKDMIVASSGNVLKDEIQGEERVWSIEAKIMRDFAWVASRDFEVVEKNVGETTLKMYFIKGSDTSKDIKELATKAGEDSLRAFNTVYGKYPYGQYSVVQTNFPSGMEYPGIVFIGKQYYSNATKEYLEIVIVHETAHQWWYSTVGNDQIDEAWLDESLAAYSEVVYVMEIYGEKDGQEYQEGYNEAMFREEGQNIVDQKILKPLNEFEGWDDYGPLVYSKGAIFLNEIYKTYGKEKVYKIFKEYYNSYRFKNATTKDFQQVCEKVIGENLTPLFDKWLLAR